MRSIAVTEENANVCSLRELLLETVRPTIGIRHEGGTLDEQGRLYDTPTLSFVVELADADAGLQAASVTVNEERLLQERWVEEQQKQATLTVELPATAKQEGENRLNVATVDHAGNRCEQTLVFYQDTTAPKILSATIDGADALKKESGYSLFPMAGAQLCVQTQDLFADAIEVELTMIAADGEKTVQRIAGDAQGMAVYSLPDGFKGVIELCAIDAAGNRSEVVTSAQMIVGIGHGPCGQCEDRADIAEARCRMHRDIRSMRIRSRRRCPWRIVTMAFVLCRGRCGQQMVNGSGRVQRR